MKNKNLIFAIGIITLFICSGPKAVTYCVGENIPTNPDLSCQ